MRKNIKCSRDNDVEIGKRLKIFELLQLVLLESKTGVGKNPQKMNIQKNPHGDSKFSQLQADMASAQPARCPVPMDGRRS